MKKLLLCIMCIITLALAGCDLFNTLPPTTVKIDETKAALDDCDFYLFTVIDRRDSGDGYEYILQKVGFNMYTEDWFYSDELFSLDESVLGIESGDDETLYLYDFE